MTDGLGLPIRFLAGPEQENDMKQAGDLIAGFHPNYVMADRAYDADRLMDAILDAGAEPVIPPRRHRRYQHYYDKVLYKERNQIERFGWPWRAVSLTASLQGFRGLANDPCKEGLTPVGSVYVSSNYTTVFM